MEGNKYALQTIGLCKKYRVGQIGGETFKADFQNLIARIAGRENPNATIGLEDDWGKEFYALNDINICIRPGETVGLIGENGAGKSTLLKLISRITAPTAGKIILNSRVSSLLEVGTGFNGEMTGRENIYLSGAILGMSRAEIEAKMEDIIDFSEVREFIDTPVKRYSSGMYVKLGFAVAAHLNNDLVIMDEVLAVGDMAFQKKCISKMHSMAKNENKAVIYVSHNMNTIRQLCDRAIVLKNGHVIYDGDVDGGIDQYLHYHVQKNQVFYDYSDLVTETRNPRNLSAMIMSVSLKGKSEWVYTPDEKMVFSVSVKANQEFSNLSMRFIFECTEHLIGACPDIRLGAFQKNQTRSFEVETDLSMFSGSNYSLSISLCEFVDGSSLLYDLLSPAVNFQILPYTDISWNSAGWGKLRFPSPLVREEES